MPGQTSLSLLLSLFNIGLLHKFIKLKYVEHKHTSQTVTSHFKPKKLMDKYDILFNAIESFAKSLSKETFGLVYYRPDRDSIATDCISNVIHYVEKYGGSSIYGWYFGHRESAKFGNYLVATHHSIWRAPDGNLFDITPFHEELKHQPLTNQGSVIFQVDTNAKPIKLGKILIPRPLKFYPISKSEDLNNYLKTLEQKEIDDYKSKFGIKIKYSK